MNRYWFIEASFVVVVVLFVLILSFFFSVIVLGLLLLFFYITWHWWHLHKLQRWLRRPSKYEPPDSVGIWHDIYHRLYLWRKKRKRDKARLVDIIAQFKASTKALPYGVVVIDKQDKILWYNQTAKQLLSLSVNDTGNAITNLVRHPDFIDYVGTNHNRMESVDFERRKASINKVINVQLVEYGVEQRLLTFRDVTRLAKLESIRQDFVANVSHELRTPLTVMEGYLEAMDDAGFYRSSPQKYHQPVKQMQQQVNAMKALVNDLLLLSRIEHNKADDKSFQPVAIEPLIEQLVKDAKILSQDNHIFNVDISAKEAYIYG